jgi:hypothetical protein
MEDEGLTRDFSPLFATIHPITGAILQTRTYPQFPVIISRSYLWLPEAETRLRNQVVVANGGNCQVMLESDDADDPFEMKPLTPEDLEAIELKDVPNDFVGGTNACLFRNGRFWVERVHQGGFADRREGSGLEGTVTALVDLINGLAFVGIGDPVRPGVPDEARPEIHVHLRSGKTLIRWKWANDPHPQFDPIYQQLLNLGSAAG